MEDNPVVPEPEPPSTTPFGDLLAKVENVASIEAFTPDKDLVGYTECYEVFFNQPIDHENPSAGTMKDGMASLFYRYFYPNDMTVTTAFCSPFMTSLYYKPVEHQMASCLPSPSSQTASSFPSDDLTKM